MDLITAILLIFIGLTIGFLLNALVSSLRKTPEEHATGQIHSPASTPDDALRLWRDPHNQKLQVEAGGKVFGSAFEMDDTQRERVARYAGELGRWLGASGELDQPVVPSPQERTSQAFLSSPAPSVAPSHPLSKEPEGPNLNPFKIFTRVLQPVIRAPGETGPESIVAQIDALLQARLEGTNLANRGIRLVETPGQGMAVQVGLESYATVEAVPDPEVQEAIRQAVADWEAGLEK